MVQIRKKFQGSKREFFHFTISPLSNVCTADIFFQSVASNFILFMCLLKNKGFNFAIV
jgi:hypothetical protein